MSTLFHKLSAKPNGFFFLPNSKQGLIYKAWLPVKTEILTSFLVAIKRALNVQSKVQVYLKLGDLGCEITTVNWGNFFFLLEGLPFKYLVQFFIIFFLT